MMPTELRPLDIRRRLGRDRWQPPVEFGPNGWRFDERNILGESYPRQRRILVSIDNFPEGGDRWIHASISCRDEEYMPRYVDLTMLHHAVWPDGHAYQCFVPPAEHVNIRSNALHLWGRADGARVLPEFGKFGTI